MRRIMTSALAAVCGLAALVPAQPASADRYAPATQIVLTRSGGFAGGRTTWIVDQRTSHGDRALALASSPEFQRLDPSYLPSNQCCDRYSYRVNVSYRGGGAKTVDAMDGLGPRVLWAVINETEKNGRQLATLPSVNGH